MGQRGVIAHGSTRATNTPAPLGAGALLAGGLAAALPAASLAHGPLAEAGARGAWQQWELSPAVVLPLLAGAALYLRGLVRVWGRAGVGRGIRRSEAAAFGTGMLVLVAALMSPLDAAAASLFSLHMVQHLLLILVAAPLLVAGAADVAFLWALPQRWRSGFGRFEHRLGGWLGGRDGAAGSGPVGNGSATGRLLVVLLATATLWVWHVPALYDLAVRREGVHMAEHASFLVTALLFWASVARLRPRDHLGNGLRILAVFAMALQGSMLGALITFASRPLYLSHQAVAPVVDLDPLTDQQIAGLIMWVPPGLLYTGVAAYLFVRWLNAVGAHSDRDRPRQLSR